MADQKLRPVAAVADPGPFIFAGVVTRRFWTRGSASLRGAAPFKIPLVEEKHQQKAFVILSAAKNLTRHPGRRLQGRSSAREDVSFLKI